MKKQQLLLPVLTICIMSLFYVDLAYARWPTPDPLAEKYYSHSPYAYCANNPIKFIDPDGRDFTDAANEIAKKLENATNSLMTSNGISMLSNSISKVMGGDANTLNAANATLESANAELGNALSEISELRGSNQMYDVKSNGRTDDVGYFDLVIIYSLTLSDFMSDQ